MNSAPRCFVIRSGSSYLANVEPATERTPLRCTWTDSISRALRYASAEYARNTARVTGGRAEAVYSDQPQ